MPIRQMLTHIRNRTNTLYQRALHRIGIADCPEMRITAAVTVSIALYYLCAIVQSIIDLALAAAPTITVLLHQ